MHYIFKEIRALCASPNGFLTKQQEKNVLLMHKTERNVKYAKVLALILDFRGSGPEPSDYDPMSQRRIFTSLPVGTAASARRKPPVMSTT